MISEHVRSDHRTCRGAFTLLLFFLSPSSLISSLHSPLAASMLCDAGEIRVPIIARLRSVCFLYSLTSSSVRHLLPFLLLFWSYLVASSLTLVIVSLSPRSPPQPALPSLTAI